MKKKITGIILCGGKNKRMGGRNKALLELKGKRFIDIIIAELKSITSEIIIISNNESDFRGFGLKVFKDIINKKTPLAGIHSGLSNMNTEYGLVIACDLPFIKKDLLNILIDEIEEDTDIVSPNEGSFFQPLCSIYSKRCIPLIKRMLEKGDVKVDHLFSSVNLKRVPYEKLKSVDANLESFININSPEDIERYEV